MMLSLMLPCMPADRQEGLGQQRQGTAPPEEARVAEEKEEEGEDGGGAADEQLSLTHVEE